MRKLVLVLTVMSFCVRNNAAILHVNTEGTGDYPTIQAAIDTASDGDVVVVAPGIYRGDGNRDIDYKGKAITVRSENGPESCVIDCQGGRYNHHRGFNFHDGEGNDSILQGFTVINGRSSYGGAIFCMDSNPVIKGCILLNNSCGGEGNGGGIGLLRTSNALVIDCVMIANYAEYGGGVACMRGDAKIINSLIVDNYADGHGGGIASGWNNTVKIVNCTIIENYARNWGGGLICTWDTDVEAVNCIIRDNRLSRSDEETGFEVSMFYDSLLTVRCSNVRGGHTAIMSSEKVDWAEGNIDADPMFAGDYRLLLNSPCVDAGNNSLVTVDTDLNGNRRIIDGDRDGLAVVDMGAYEYINPITAPVANAGEDVIASVDNQGTAIVILDGSLSYDDNGDSLEYFWFCDGELFGQGVEVEAELGFGEFVFTLIVNDGNEDSLPDEVVVTVMDDISPEFSVRLDKRILWPANNKMIKVTPSFEAIDNCGGQVIIELAGITCNQKSPNDIEVTDEGIFLRATRDANDTKGRTYTITYKATDESGNENTASAETKVPHDLGRRRSISRRRQGLIKKLPKPNARRR